MKGMYLPTTIVPLTSNKGKEMERSYFFLFVFNSLQLDKLLLRLLQFPSSSHLFSSSPRPVRLLFHFPLIFPLLLLVLFLFFLFIRLLLYLVSSYCLLSSSMSPLPSYFSSSSSPSFFFTYFFLIFPFSSATSCFLSSTFLLLDSLFCNGLWLKKKEDNALTNDDEALEMDLGHITSETNEEIWDVRGKQGRKTFKICPQWVFANAVNNFTITSFRIPLSFWCPHFYTEIQNSLLSWVSLKLILIVNVIVLPPIISDIIWDISASKYIRIYLPKISKPFLQFWHEE